MNLRLRAAVLAAVLLLPALACSLTNDIQDAVETVDQAGDLLREIDQDGAWDTVEKGLTGLATQTQGYTATTTLRRGTVNASGAYEGALAQDVVVNLQVDGQNDAVAQVSAGGQSGNFVVDGNPGGGGVTRVYRVESDGRYTCVNDTQEGRLLRGGIKGVFEEYSLLAIGVQLLATAQEAGEDTVAGRTVTHYQLVSKIPDALEVLKKFDNQELQDKINAAGRFELSGDLYLDQETDALLRFSSVYSQLDQQQRTELNWEVTQWGGVADIAEPAPDQIAVPCTE